MVISSPLSAVICDAVSYLPGKYGKRGFSQPCDSEDDEGSFRHWEPTWKFPGNGTRAIATSSRKPAYLPAS